MIFLQLMTFLIFEKFLQFFIYFDLFLRRVDLNRIKQIGDFLIQTCTLDIQIKRSGLRISHSKVFSSGLIV